MPFRIYCCMFAVLLWGTLPSCRNGFSHKNRVVIIQPFSGFPQAQALAVFGQIASIHAICILKEPVALPAAAFYAPRNRYRADSLLNYLQAQGSADTVVIGLTTKDISVTKGAVADWGIMGYARQPGSVCVVSTFRLDKSRMKDQLFKVAVHELGHTQGLPHCPEKSCYMRNAAGGNPLNEETDFCASCKSFLKRKGWKLK